MQHQAASQVRVSWHVEIGIPCHHRSRGAERTTAMWCTVDCARRSRGRRLRSAVGFFVPEQTPSPAGQLATRQRPSSQLFSTKRS